MHEESETSPRDSGAIPEKKALVRESEGQETALAPPGPYGSPRAWNLLELPLLATRLVLDHTPFFLSLALAGALAGASGASFLSWMVWLTTMSAALVASRRGASLSPSEVFQPVGTQIGTLVVTNLLLGLATLATLVVFGILASLVSFTELSSPVQFLLGALAGSTVALLYSSVTFLGAVVVESGAGATACIERAFRLFRSHLAGNLVVVGVHYLVLGLGLAAAVLLPYESSLALLLVPLGMQALSIWGHVMVTLRYRQLMEWEELYLEE